MSKIYQDILDKKARREKMFAVLLDPEKCVDKLLYNVLKQLKYHHPDLIFIGGSGRCCNTEDLIKELNGIPVPKVLFPGDASQFSPKADALLFLSLISGRNPDYLIGQHVKSAIEIKKSAVEIIPTGYILIDGGTDSSVKRVSKTEPIGADDIATACSTAVAGELLGMKMIYLEAGSGAKNPVSSEMITAVAAELSIPMIVGGGIKTTKQLKTAFDAGADLVVVGNLFEKETERIGEFVQFVERYKLI